jgi:hypothetical protein
MWTNYEIEEAEVAIDMADMVLEQLVLEAVQGLMRIEEERKPST